MKLEDLIAAERLIWRRVLAVSNVVEGFQVIRGAGLPEDCEDIAVNREGEGALSWVTEESGMLESLTGIAVGLPQADNLPLALDYHDHRVEPVTLRMMGRSNWSKAWYPISQMAVWPGEVLLEKDEVKTVMACEVDFFSILAFDEEHQQFRVLAFRRDEQPLHAIIDLAKKMHDPVFQHKFFTAKSMKEVLKNPRLDKDEPLDRRPPGEMLLTPYIYDLLQALPRTGKRLYEHHWVHRLVNTDNPILYNRYTAKNNGE